MAEARKDKRTLLSLKIRYKSATLEDFMERYSNDVSRGGVFIKSRKPLAVGTLLKFEFLLQDQSSVIHGVGRVVWKREEAEGDSDNPAGMGIKFIKMDPTCRSLVAQIIDDREEPGRFDQGSKDPAGPPEKRTDPTELSDDFESDERTEVRHVSEFLESAFAEGGASEAAMKEAQAGAERAREASRSLDDRMDAARAALGTRGDVPTAQQPKAPEASSRRASTAFGGGSSGSEDQTPTATPEGLVAASNDFLDDEDAQTRVHEYTEAETSNATRPLPTEPEVIGAAGVEVADEVAKPAAEDGGGSGWLRAVVFVLVVALVGVAAWRYLSPGAGFKEAAGTQTLVVDKPVAQKPAAPAPAVVAEPPSEVVEAVTEEAVVAEAVTELEAQKTPTEEAPEPVEPVAGLAKLSVTSEPNGAVIRMKGKVVGKTPTELDVVVGSEIVLVLRAPGHMPKRDKIKVLGGEQAHSVKLFPLPYVLEVVTEPFDARASVGGRSTSTPGEIRSVFASLLPRAIILDMWSRSFPAGCVLAGGPGPGSVCARAR